MELRLRVNSLILAICYTFIFKLQYASL